MEETISIFEGKCLVFEEENYKNELNDAKINQNILLEIKNTLNKINVAFINILDLWGKNSKKEDLLVVYEDFDEFKGKS